jgi:hypothetical protein
LRCYWILYSAVKHWEGQNFDGSRESVSIRWFLIHSEFQRVLERLWNPNLRLKPFSLLRSRLEAALSTGSKIVSSEIMSQHYPAKSTMLQVWEACISPHVFFMNVAQFACAGNIYSLAYFTPTSESILSMFFVWSLQTCLPLLSKSLCCSCQFG